MKTEGLKQALNANTSSTPPSAARAATRRRAGPRSASTQLPRPLHQWDPKNQRPELWNLYNGRMQQGREHPRVPALQLDRARRLALHPPREDADGAAVLRQGAPGGGSPRHADHASTTSACRSSPARRPDADASGALPHARLLSADRRGRARPTTVPKIIEEMLLTATSERQGRVIDHDERGLDGAEEAGRILLMKAAGRSS